MIDSSTNPFVRRQVFGRFSCAITLASIILGPAASGIDELACAALFSRSGCGSQTLAAQHVRCRGCGRRRWAGQFRSRSAKCRTANGALSSYDPVAQSPWRALFDGKTLDGWKATNFGGEGDVNVSNGQIVMEMGSSLTGVTYQKKLPKTNYEIQLEAMRLDGIDFFCGLTFPVEESHCSLIVGGWAGAVVGLSSIDGLDASENKTTRYMNFKDKQWYRVRVRVTKKKIDAWIDDRQVVDQDITGRKISTRPEVDLSKPLGISVWETKSALRRVQLRELPQK